MGEERTESENIALLQLKAKWFDQIVEKYNGLQAGAEFYSKNWVELAEVIDAALEHLKQHTEES